MLSTSISGIQGNPILQVELIPAELRARHQWVIWRSIVADGKVTKPPFNPNNPNYMANVMDPQTWGSFEDVIRVWNANPSLVQGIGFVFTDQDEFFGIDIDDESKVAPENLDARRRFVDQVLHNVHTYAEISPSGQGLHLIGRGKLAVPGRRSTRMQVEVYSSQRYFTITGNIYDNRTQITDQQEFLNQIAGVFAPEQQSPEGTIGDIASNRRLDLTDEEVIRAAANYTPSFAPRYNAQMGCEPGEWSETFMAVVGILDQITGKVDQLYRIVMNSPMVLAARPSNSGEARVSKAERNFNHVLARVRGNNNALLNRVEHGRQVAQAMDAAKEERARKAAEEILAKSEEGFSANGVELLKAFPLDPRCLTLTPPPGYAGEFVQATMGACYNPFLKFSIPATIAVLTGILGRAYKLPSGSGLNSNFILAAPSATGKTQTMDAWEGFLNRASRSIENTLSGPSRSRIIKASASSIQGIFEDFMQTPSAAWFISECHGQLQKMSDPKSAVDSQLRDAYNDLYDASKVGRMFSPPRSVANRKGGLEPIENLSISTYWTTTTSKFDIFNEDAQDGFLSRVTIIRHDGAAGDVIPSWEVIWHLPDHLNAMLIHFLGAAKNFDETYAMNAGEGAKLVTRVSDEQIYGHTWAFQQIAERIKNTALAGQMPVAYTAVARLPAIALRVAGMLAVVENPYSPSITPPQYEWAFGYLLQNLAQLLSAMDTGQVGATMSQDVEVVINSLKRLMRLQKQTSIKRSVLVDRLKRIEPFKSARSGPGAAIKATLQEMVSDGLLIELHSRNEHNQNISLYSFTSETPNLT